jgi:hypothetical protein
MSEPIISICCAAATEVISYHVFKMQGGEIIDTSYRCLSCGHKFHIWSDSKTNKIAPEILEEKHER